MLESGIPDSNSKVLAKCTKSHYRPVWPWASWFASLDLHFLTRVSKSLEKGLSEAPHPHSKIPITRLLGSVPFQDNSATRNLMKQKTPFPVTTHSAFPLPQSTWRHDACQEHCERKWGVNEHQQSTCRVGPCCPYYWASTVGMGDGPFYQLFQGRGLSLGRVNYFKFSPLWSH